MVTAWEQSPLGYWEITNQVAPNTSAFDTKPNEYLEIKYTNIERWKHSDNTVQVQ